MTVSDPSVAAPTTAAGVSPCAEQLFEITGRDRAVATRIRSEAAKLIRLAEALEINANIATAVAADGMAE